MKIIKLWIWTLVLGLPGALSAGDVSTWKENDGVRQFSNDPPPAHTRDYMLADADAAGAQSANPSNKRRSSYDEMVERATREADASREERKKEEAAKEAEKKRIVEEKENARIQAERERLEAEIEKVKNRAVSPTFPNGMKQAQIEALQKEIEDLEKGDDASEKKE